MATISVTFTSGETGVVTSSVRVSEDNVRRILAAMKSNFEEQANDQEPEYMENAAGEEVEVPRERVSYTNKEVCEQVGINFIHNLINQVIAHERHLLLKNTPIKPIEILE